jgi:hypothetical protein
MDVHVGRREFVLGVAGALASTANTSPKALTPPPSYEQLMDWAIAAATKAQAIVQGAMPSAPIPNFMIYRRNIALNAIGSALEALKLAR